LARLATCGADPELVALCQECLAAEWGARPSNGGVVAERVAAYQAGVQERLRRAELERAAAEAREQQAQATAAAERTARRRTRALAVALLALIGLGTGGGLWVQYLAAARRADRIQRATEQRQTIESALEKAAALRQQARWREAAAVLEQGRQALGDAGPDDLRQRLDKAEAELALVTRLDAIRQRRAVLGEEHFDYRTAAHDYAGAFADAGLGEVGDDEEMVSARISTSGVAGPLIAALDDWASLTGEPPSRAWLLGVARRAAPDPWGNRFRDPVVWRDRQALQTLAEEVLRDNGAKLGEWSPQLLAALGALMGGSAEAVPLLRAAQRRYPDDFWLNLDLGNALTLAKHMEAAVGYYRAAVALRPDFSAAHTNLGVALRHTKDLDGAIAAFHQATELNLNDMKAHNNLGAALYEKGNLAGAIAAFRQAIELDPTYAGAYSNLGNALYAKQDLYGAIAAFRQAIELQFKDAGVHYHLGIALRDTKDLNGAITEYRKAIAIDPSLAGVHENLGNALFKRGDLKGAIAAFRQAIEFDPKDAKAFSNLGVALRHTNDLKGAIAAFRQAAELDPKDTRILTNLGLALGDDDDVNGAIAVFRKAIDIHPKDASTHFHLGNALDDNKDLDGAIDEYRKAIELDPTYAAPHINLGVALAARNDLPGAIAEYRKAIELDPAHAAPHNNLGFALATTNDLTGAMVEYRKAIELDSTYAEPHYNLGLALYRKQDLDGAMTEYRKAIQLNPKYLEAYDALGGTLLRQGRFAEARTAARRTLELLAEGDPARPVAQQRLKQCELLVTLDEKLPAILAGKAEPAGAPERLALGQLCWQYKHRYAAAARFYADAFATDPKLADDLQRQHRYHAACSAALASAGQGEDAKDLSDQERLKLRQHALDWLRADLTLYARRIESAEPAAKRHLWGQLAQWQKDTGLASVRDKAALDQLREDERKQWRELWDEVNRIKEGQ
jgi:tetratricopeptide (TPR) repeat protein